MWWSSAGGDGVPPACSSFWLMNRSMGCSAGCDGGPFFRMGRYAQCCNRSSKCRADVSATISVVPLGLGSGAPSSIQRRTSAMVDSGSRPEGGIRKSGLWYSRASRSLELDGSPGRRTAPASPPFSRPSGVDKTSPPRILSPPWQLTHSFTSMGRTVRSNSSTPGSVASSNKRVSTPTIYGYSAAN